MEETKLDKFVDKIFTIVGKVSNTFTLPCSKKSIKTIFFIGLIQLFVGLLQLVLLIVSNLALSELYPFKYSNF